MILTSQTSANSESIYCSSLVDGQAVNDSVSERALWYEIYEDIDWGLNQQVHSEKILVGEGAMDDNQRVKTWSNRFTQKSVNAWNGNARYYVHLDPEGALKKGCLGAGKLID